jgi:hypothetical protein
MGVQFAAGTMFFLLTDRPYWLKNPARVPSSGVHVMNKWRQPSNPTFRDMVFNKAQENLNFAFNR